MKKIFVICTVITFLTPSAFADTKEFQRSMKAAKNGDPEAQCYVGFMYVEGKETKKNYQEALKWFEKSAKQNFAPAQYMMGLAYYSGDGVKKRDLQKAATWYQRAAFNGLADAQFELSLMYLSGQGVKHDDTAAFELMKMAAEQEYVKAQHCLGTIVYERIRRKSQSL